MIWALMSGSISCMLVKLRSSAGRSIMYPSSSWAASPTSTTTCQPSTSQSWCSPTSLTTSSSHPSSSPPKLRTYSSACLLSCCSFPFGGLKVWRSGLKVLLRNIRGCSGETRGIYITIDWMI